MPNQPIFVSPTNDAKGSSSITFSWNIPSDIGEVQSTLSSVIEIATDNGFANIIETIATGESSQEVTFTNVGDYYWRVRIVDQADNKSVYSEIRKITVE